ncbi:MAG TPA: phosphoenolpyruvate synthase, partial [Acidimicrobiales bacterium]|nr:phosphoenolpyruvate synthase [Acidimicrobiales bacterium]
MATQVVDEALGGIVERIRWFKDLKVTDPLIAGGKGANLGELTSAGLPVPPGFVVTADAYLEALDQAGVRERLVALIRQVDPSDDASTEKAAEAARALIETVAVPSALKTELLAAYHALGEDVIVAVRSSGTTEDAEGASFAGMNATFTNVSGDRELLERLVDCWASLYGARVIVYRATKSLADEPAIAVIVQEMIPSERSGVMFTVDPSDEASKNLVIEGAFGQGEVVVSGQVEPDTYTVSRDGPRLISTRIGTKDFKIIRGADLHDERVELEGPAAIARVLSDDEVIELARIGLRAEEHYGTPQDMEWAIANGTMYIVQSRPITTLHSRAGHETAGRVLLTGLAASHGRASGAVRVLLNPSDGSKLIDGEILVAPMTSPDWVPTMRRAAALVTENGGMTCHAAIVSRELGVPCVVGARQATKILRDGEVITVDGQKGIVLEGVDLEPPPSVKVVSEARVGTSRATTPLATRLYVNLGMPEHAEEVAAMDVDGVGLLRAEFMVTDALGGEHPRALLERGDEKIFVDKMTEDMLRITRAFHPRPVVYRSIDFRTNEFANLKGGEQYELPESNPMIGYRGCFRYTKEPDLFGLELEILARVASETPNIKLMIPFVRTRFELEAVLEQVERSVV